MFGRYLFMNVFSADHNEMRTEMTDFNERLDKIRDRISDKDFLANRGVANEVRYYVFDYEPCDELIIRDKIRALKRQNNPEADGFRLWSMTFMRWLFRYWRKRDIWINASGLKSRRGWNICIRQ